MKKTPGSLAFLAVGAVVLLAGCSSLKVGNDYNPSADFPRFVSFDWLDNRPGVTAEARTAGTLDTSLRRAVESELVSKRMVLDSTNPELLVIYHVGEDDGIDAGRWGYRYEDVGKGWGGDIDVRGYRAGTLVLNLVDAATMCLVWRASADGAFRKNDPPDRVEERMYEAVRRMFEVYPPAR